MIGYWRQSDREAAAIAAEARALPTDDTDPVVDAKLKELESRAKRLGYNDCTPNGVEGAGRTWTDTDAGVWCACLNDAYDEGMNQWEADHP